MMPHISTMTGGEGDAIGSTCIKGSIIYPGAVIFVGLSPLCRATAELDLLYISFWPVRHSVTKEPKRHRMPNNRITTRAHAHAEYHHARKAKTLATY